MIEINSHITIIVVYNSFCISITQCIPYTRTSSTHSCCSFILQFQRSCSKYEMRRKTGAVEWSGDCTHYFHLMPTQNYYYHQEIHYE
nr:hypothetical protein Iba_chr04dCG11770 [Ipomoea batatas]